MTLTELISGVYELTGRPDLIAETKSAIKNATLFGHQRDFFFKDLVEVGLAFDSAEYVQTLNVREVIPLWRAHKYFKKYDPTQSPPVIGCWLTKVVPENVLDDYKSQKQDIWYVAGQQININSSTQQQYYLIGYYSNPDLSDTGYNSWIALDHPYYLIHRASAQIFKQIGKDEEAAQQRVILAEQEANLIRNNIDGQGY